MKEVKYITANKDVNIIYDSDKKEFYLKVPRTCLLKCHIPKDEFMREVEKCFNRTRLDKVYSTSRSTIPEARLRLSIKPTGEWSVSFSHSPIELIEFLVRITSTKEITPQEAGELLYKQFITCNGKVAVDMTIWYT